MTINATYIHDLERYTATAVTEEQKRVILDRFGTEPEPYEWSEQDIAVQMRNYLSCGEFSKSA